MYDWIHCNRCHNFQAKFPAVDTYFLTRCGHLLCALCNSKSLNSGSCVVCNAHNVTSVDLCSNELPENVKIYFVPRERIKQQLSVCLSDLRKHVDSIREVAGRLYECIKINDFQISNESRLITFLKQEAFDVSKRFGNVQASEKKAWENLRETELALKRLQLDFESYKRSNPPTPISKNNSSLMNSSASFLDKFDMPSGDFIRSTPSQRIESNRLHLPLPSPSPSISRAMASYHIGESTRNETQRNPTVSRIQAKFQSNTIPPSPASARIAVSAFQGKARNEFLQMTPASGGSFDSSFYSPVRRTMLAKPNSFSISTPGSGDSGGSVRNLSRLSPGLSYRSSVHNRSSSRI